MLLGLVIYKQEPNQIGVGGFGLGFLSLYVPALAARYAATAPPRWRGPGPRPITAFKYNLRRRVPSNSYLSPARDNLVSDVPGSSTMSSSHTSSGDTGVVTVADLAKRFATMEDLLRPLQPLMNKVAALEQMVKDQGNQQAALNLALTHVESALPGYRMDGERSSAHDKSKTSSSGSADPPTTARRPSAPAPRR